MLVLIISVGEQKFLKVAKQHDVFVRAIASGVLMCARASFWLDEIIRKLFECFNEELPKLALVPLTDLVFHQDNIALLMIVFILTNSLLDNVLTWLGEIRHWSDFRATRVVLTCVSWLQRWHSNQILVLVLPLSSLTAAFLDARGTRACAPRRKRQLQQLRRPHPWAPQPHLVRLVPRNCVQEPMNTGGGGE